jgi:TatD DNase family protein
MLIPAPSENPVLADAHAHLDEPEMLPDQDQVVARARQAGVSLIINVGISRPNSEAVLATAARYPEVYAAVGVHPHGAVSLTPRELARLRELAAHPKVVALGEMGLDFYRRRSPEEVQRRAFREQLELAWELKKPVVVHTREATADTLALLREYRSRLAGGVMHCFGGSLAEAQAFLDLGLYLSFSGVLTYPKAEPLRQVAREVPLDRVLIETDCPYLAPQAWRGRRNEPAYVLAVAETLARLHDLPVAEVARQTFHNALAAFGLGAGQAAFRKERRQAGRP